MFNKFSFQCPNCSRKVYVPRENAGKRGECPKCNVSLLIPSMKKGEKRNFTVKNKVSTGNIMSTSFKILFSWQIIKMIQIFLILWIPFFLVNLMIGPIKEKILLNIVLIFLFYPIPAGATVKIIQDIYQKKTISLSDSIKKSFSKYFSIFGSLLLIIFAAVGMLIVSSTSIAFLDKMMYGLNQKTIHLILSPFAIIFSIIGLYIINSLIVIIPAIVTENLNPRKASKRSRELTKGGFFQASSIFFVYFMIILIPTLIIIYFLGIKTEKVNYNLLVSITDFISLGIGTMFFSIATAVYYFELCVNKESFSLNQTIKIFD